MKTIFVIDNFEEFVKTLDLTQEEQKTILKCIISISDGRHTCAEIQLTKMHTYISFLKEMYGGDLDITIEDKRDFVLKCLNKLQFLTPKDLYLSNLDRFIWNNQIGYGS